MTWKRHHTSDGWTWYSYSTYVIQRFGGPWKLYRDGELIGRFRTLREAKAAAIF